MKLNVFSHRKCYLLDCSTGWKILWLENLAGNGSSPWKSFLYSHHFHCLFVSLPVATFFFCGVLLGCQCRTDFSNFSSLIAKTFIKLSNNFKQSIYLPVVLLSHLPSSRQFLGVETSQWESKQAGDELCLQASVWYQDTNIVKKEITICL